MTVPTVVPLIAALTESPLKVSDSCCQVSRPGAATVPLASVVSVPPVESRTIDQAPVLLSCR